MIIEDKYQFKPLPFSPGGEAASIVSEIGSVEGFNIGDRVIVSSGWGSFAEKYVDQGSLTPIPESMDFDTAASF